MLLKIIDIKSIDPYFNIATEKRYYENIKDDEIILLLWQNDKSVIIGRNQNIYQEVDLSYIKNNDIKPVRRFTGGGAVYHDLGNLNFSIISTSLNKDVSLWITIIINALKELSINAYKKGRNDLLCNEKKISGMAYMEDDDKFLIHGTLMLDLNLDELIKSLTPDINKFKGKGIKSIKSRVSNIKDINKDIDIRALKESIINEFKKYYPNFIEESHKKNQYELDILEILKSYNWIYGKDEKAEIRKIINIDNKDYIFDIWICDNLINDVEIYTDSLNVGIIDNLKRSLLNKRYEDINWNNITEDFYNKFKDNSCLI